MEKDSIQPIDDEELEVAVGGVSGFMAEEIKNSVITGKSANSEHPFLMFLDGGNNW